MAVGGKQENFIYVWTMKSTLDHDKPQELLYSLDIQVGISHILPLRTTLDRYLAVAKINGDIDIYSLETFEKILSINGLFLSKFTVFTEFKRGSRFIGSLGIASDSCQFKMLSLNLVERTFSI